PTQVNGSNIRIAVTDVGFTVTQFAFNFISTSVLSGATVRMVTQLMVAPLRPLSLRKAFAAVKKRLPAVLWTTALTSILIMFGLILCFIPGFIFMVLYSPTMPVVMMEALSGRTAMRRAKELVKRSLKTVVAITVIQFGIPFLGTLFLSIL